jgi:hypothetical protein
MIRFSRIYPDGFAGFYRSPLFVTPVKAGTLRYQLVPEMLVPIS